MKSLGDWFKNYRKLAYIDTGIVDFRHYMELTRRQAESKGWEYEDLKGSVNLIQKLMDGQWDEKDFLIYPHWENHKGSLRSGTNH